MATPLQLGVPQIAVGASAIFSNPQTSAVFSIPDSAVSCLLSLARVGLFPNATALQIVAQFSFDGVNWDPGTGFITTTGDTNGSSSFVTLTLPAGVSRQMRVVMTPITGTPSLGAVSITVN